MAMKQTSVSARRRAARTGAAERAQLLAAFDSSGFSAAEFARQQRVHYTTFCAWRRQRDQAKTSPPFVEVELAPPAQPVELVLEVGVARLRLGSEAQLPLAARLLQILQEAPRC
jgi:hypothetical protein